MHRGLCCGPRGGDHPGPDAPEPLDVDRDRRVPRRIDDRRALPGAARRRRGERRLAHVRVRRRRDRPVRLGRRRADRVHGAARDADHRAPPADPYPLQRGGVRALGLRGRHRDRAAPRRRRLDARPADRGVRVRLLRREHAAREQLPGAQPRRVVPRHGQEERALDDRAVHADGVGLAHPRRALGARAGPLDRTRGPAARDRALPALDLPRAEGDAARPHRPADRPRQPPPLPRAAAAGPGRGRGAEGSRHRLPGRHRRLQEDQRPLRPPLGRPRAGAGVEPPPPGR